MAIPNSNQAHAPESSFFKNIKIISIFISAYKYSI